MLSLQTIRWLVVNFPGINSPYGPVGENAVTLNKLNQMMMPIVYAALTLSVRACPVSIPTNGKITMHTWKHNCDIR